MKKIILIAGVFFSLAFSNNAKAVDFTIVGKCRGVVYTNSNDRIKATITCEGTTGTCADISTKDGVVHVTFYCDDGPINVTGSGPGVFDGTPMDEIGDGVVFPAGTYELEF